MLIAGVHDALNCFKLDRKRICAAVVFVMVVAAMSLYYQHVENSWFSAAIDISDNISTLLAETDFDHVECSGDTLVLYKREQVDPTSSVLQQVSVDMVPLAPNVADRYRKSIKDACKTRFGIVYARQIDQDGEWYGLLYKTTGQQFAGEVHIEKNYYRISLMPLRYR